ncbi:MAG: RiPP maturation radical SAM protein 1 [bacterium]|nr:RiPP maturation radical SAM protein 1 [bacterium]
MSDVVLVVLPFTSDVSPSIGPSLLKSVLRDRDIDSEVFYANLLYKNDISHFLYDKIAVAYSSYLLSEYVFSSEAFPAGRKTLELFEKKYRDYKFKTSYPGDYVVMEELTGLRKEAGNSIEQIVESILKKDPKIVGFQSSNNQVMASIAAARVLKNNNPRIITVMGGYNCQEPMGSAILEITNSIDYIFSGDAEFKFTAFCENALHNVFPQNRIINCEPVLDLDSLPYPDYTDYFKEMQFAHFRKKVRMPFESGRGCWWGEKTHCVFCGGNGLSICHRQKSPERIAKEINELVEKYSVSTFYPTDNIIPKNRPRQLIDPGSDSIKEMYYELRPTIPFEELYDLKRNRLTLCQPGIETFNNRLLGILRKGTTAAGNVRFLRDCKSLKIFPAWSFLYDIPGEKEEDYLEILSFLPYITHLTPPSKINPVVIQRYSPLFDSYKDFNIEKLQPLEFYYHMFPAITNFDKISIYFEGTYSTAFCNEDLKEKFFSLLGDWSGASAKIKSILQLARLTSEYYLVIDTRDVGKKTFSVLDEQDFAVLDFLFVPASKIKVRSFLSSNDLQKKFDMLLNSGFILEIEDSFVNLLVESIRETKLANENGPEPEKTNSKTAFQVEQFMEDLNSNPGLFSDLKRDTVNLLASYGLFLTEYQAKFIKDQFSSIFL